jgi:RNase P subunit RPR2
VCPKCGSDMKIIAIILHPEETTKTLRHLVKSEQVISIRAYARITDTIKNHPCQNYRLLLLELNLKL